MMQRYAFNIEYDGRGFVGWQRQNNGLGVQQALEEACTRAVNQPIHFTICGRTDSGVHALGQVAHADMPLGRKSPREMAQMINYHVRPHPVSVVQMAMVPDTFEARFHCIQRSYCYRILNRDAPPMIESGRVLHVVKPLCVPTMQHAAQQFLGMHDFTTFRGAGCGANSPMRIMDEVHISKTDDLIEIHFKARSFLYRQVRSMVGTLLRIGHGYAPPNYVQTALQAKDRRACGPVAEAHGLYFMAARYPTNIFSTPDATTV